jgi:hypothetical protein
MSISSRKAARQHLSGHSATKPLVSSGLSTVLARMAPAILAHAAGKLATAGTASARTAMRAVKDSLAARIARTQMGSGEHKATRRPAAEVILGISSLRRPTAIVGSSRHAALRAAVRGAEGLPGVVPEAVTGTTPPARSLTCASQW